MQIKGQDELLNKINSFTLDTFPKSIILEGSRGSGKHLISKFIAERFNLELVDVTEEISFELLESLKLRVTPYLYLIDASKISQKDENTILKFLEEPLKNSFIVILTTNKYSLLQTIINRCQVFKLAKYSKEFLINEFGATEEQAEIASTPGKLEIAKKSDVKAMMDLANKIFTKVKTANFSNILTIPNKISFDKDESKFDFDLFVDVLVITITNLVKSDIDSKLVLYYNETNKLANDRNVANINKKLLFDNYLCALKVI